MYAMLGTELTQLTISSNLGPPALLNCTPLRRYTGHRDGIWEVSVSRMRLPILGTASADHTAIIWGMHSGQALLQYTGHAGSVNSLRFHPTKVCNLVCNMYLLIMALYIT